MALLPVGLDDRLYGPLKQRQRRVREPVPHVAEPHLQRQDLGGAHGQQDFRQPLQISLQGKKRPKP